MIHMLTRAFAAGFFCTAAPMIQAQFTAAPQPASGAVSPVNWAEQRGRFTLPPGFEIELVASEEEGAGKPITVAWDDAGRMWTMTALEYPLDGNEQPAEAKALYERGGQDRVLVFDEPYGPGPRRARVFAEGMAMPMGILPYKDGALVGQGPDVFWMRDTDEDGKAERREVILTGFGVQDSHLMPHQFMRAPGNWFYLAQGAFNYSQVKTRDGRTHKFNQTRLARFTVDGMRFEDVTCGPCNIWGMVIGQEGEGFIQEANDYGYPVMALHAGASYPGCSGAFKPYAPYFPSEVEFRIGGTGLSGLALSDPGGGFPGAYAEVHYIANPITRKIQAIKAHRDGPRHRYELLGDFVLSADEWFRPVAIHFGPDNNLYIVDWYNKIISHNEVPRTHPERDKTRGRIWRVRHKDQPRSAPPNLAKAAEGELLKHLRSESTWEMRAAWHQIVDRPAAELAPELRKLAMDRGAKAHHRIHALWCLEGLDAVDLEAVRSLLAEGNRNLRREGIRSLAHKKFSISEIMATLRAHTADTDPEVRAEVIRVAALHAADDAGAIALLGGMIQPALAQPAGVSPHSGTPMKLREAYDREFERYLIRSTAEKMPGPVGSYLGSAEGKNLPTDSRLLLTLALPAEQGAAGLVALLPQLGRAPNEEELLRLAENARSPAAAESIRKLLEKDAARRGVLEALLKVRGRADVAEVGPLIASAVQKQWAGGDREFAARVAGGFRVPGMAGNLGAALQDAEASPGILVASLRALRELGEAPVGPLGNLARSHADRAVRDEALNSLAAAKGEEGAAAILEFWPKMSVVQRRAGLRELTATAGAGEKLLAALAKGRVEERDLDALSLERLSAALPKSPEVRGLVERLGSQFRPVLRLDGKNESFADSNINLEGAFTVEAWVRLEPGISNEDGILGYPGGADFNFAGGVFRVYFGPEYGDRAIAKKPMTADAWTHLALSRDAGGIFRLYLNGELNTTDERALTVPLTGLDVGRTSPQGAGTAGDLLEFRVWDRAREAGEIRADFDRTYAGEPKPAGLTHYFPGSGPWGTLKGNAQVEKVSDAPALMTAEQARAQAAKLERFHALAQAGGAAAKGRETFVLACATCHTVGGQGGQIGPVLNGAGASGIEALLRSVLTPNAAMEAGYRTFRVEQNDGETLDGFLVSQDDQVIVLRQPNSEDKRIAKTAVRRAGFTRTSLMPEGLLEALNDSDAKDLLAYLMTLK